MTKIVRCPEGHEGRIYGCGDGSFFVSCSRPRTCWNGPLAITTRGAVHKWNRGIGKSKDLQRKCQAEGFDRGYQEGGGD